MILRKKHRPSERDGLTVVEIMISLLVLAVIMAATMTGFTAISGSMAAAENYSVGQLATVDFLTLDLRRSATDFAPFKSGETLTLPITFGLPQYYMTDGRTPSPPQKTLVTSSNKRSDRKRHRVISARYYYHYGALNQTVPVQYYLLNNVLYRKEGSQAARAVGSGISAVTFSSPAVAADATAQQKLDAIAVDPVVTTTVAFAPTKYSKAAPPSLSNSTFMRQYYYSDF